MSDAVLCLFHAKMPAIASDKSVLVSKKRRLWVFGLLSYSETAAYELSN